MLISLTSEKTEMFITSDISPLVLFIPQRDEIQDSHHAQSFRWPTIGIILPQAPTRLVVDDPGVSGNRCHSSHVWCRGASLGRQPRDAYQSHS